MKTIILLFTAFFCFSNCLFSQKLDTQFAGKGFVTTNFGKDVPYSEFGSQVIPQKDGTSIVVVEIADAHATLSHYLSDGKLDSSYGEKGYGQMVRLIGAKAVQQSDGKIVVAGEFDISGGDGNKYKVVIVRYNKNGSLDSSFGVNGTAKPVFNEFSAFITAIAFDSNKNIVVAGYIDSGSEESSSEHYAVARYKSDGSLDSGFGKGGSLTLEFNGSNEQRVTSMAVQSDGKIILSGPVYSELTLVRLNTDGTIDNTFGKDGKITIDNKGYVSYLALETDGKIVVCYDKGYNTNQIVLTRFKSNGSLDVNFGVGGRVATHFTSKLQITSIALQNNGKIVLSLWESNSLAQGSKDFLIARYNGDGTPDAGFDGDGVLKTDFGYNEAANAVAIQSDGKILAVGSSYKVSENGGSTYSNLAFSRYNSNGSPDNTFSGDGKKLNTYTAPPSSSLYCIATQTDGKVLVGGFIEKASTTSFVIARYTRDGLLDSSFGIGGKVRIDFPTHASAASISLQSNGKIVVAVRENIVVFNTDGSLDKTFNKNGILNTVFYNISSLEIQKDDKIVVAGETLNYTDSIIRYNIDGSLDKSFLADKTFFAGSDYISHIAIQADGKIVGAGSVHIVGAGSVLVRFNTDGTIDNTFGTNGKQKLTNTDVNSVAIDVGGKILVGGYITTGFDYSTLARFNKDGSIDNTFTAADFSKLSFFMTSLVSTSDDKIILTGEEFSNRGNITVIKLKNDGSLDSGFNGNGVSITDLGYYEHADALALYNNKLYVAGSLMGETVHSSGLVVAYNLTDVNKAPAVTLTTPANNTTRLAPAAHIKLSAAAADKDGTITKVEFYNGTKLLHTETVFPYGYVWEHVPLGNYTLTAKAYDNSGNVTTSAPVHISVVPNKPPVVSITKPVNNRSFAAPGYIHLEAAASDTDGRVTNVKFYNGSSLLRTEYEYPYTYHWENVPAGTYTITAVATDNWGAHTTSAPVTIVVTSSNAMIVSNKPINTKTGMSNEISLNLYPNPATNVLNINTSALQQSKPATISIIGVSGIVLKTMQTNNSTTQLDVSSLAKGVYTIKIVSGDKVMFKQFVKS